jgi:hypothetical protein
MQLGGLGSERLRVLTTNAGSSRAASLQQQGLTVVQGDLDDPASLEQVSAMPVTGTLCKAAVTVEIGCRVQATT